jgi:hypothetical protein
VFFSAFSIFMIHFDDRPPTSKTQADKARLYRRISALTNNQLTWAESKRHDPGIFRDWSKYQSFVLANIQRQLKEKHIDYANMQYRVLVASAVANHLDTVDRFEKTIKRLRANKSADRFQFALIHFDEDDDLWKKRDWYNDDSIVVVKKKEAGCKMHFITQLTTDITNNYDYIWLIDEDMDLQLFNWDLYRSAHVLLGKPLLSQPAYISKSGTSYPTNRMECKIDVVEGVDKTSGYNTERYQEGLHDASEVLLVEIGSPIASTKIFDAMVEQVSSIKEADLTSDWGFDARLSAFGVASKHYCNTVGNVVVFASPVIHVNSRTLLAGSNHTRELAGSNRSCAAKCKSLCEAWTEKQYSGMQHTLGCGSFGAMEDRTNQVLKLFNPINFMEAAKLLRLIGSQPRRTWSFSSPRFDEAASRDTSAPAQLDRLKRCRVSKEHRREFARQVKCGQNPRCWPTCDGNCWHK